MAAPFDCCWVITNDAEELLPTGKSHHKQTHYLTDINTWRQTLLSAKEKLDFVAFVLPGLHQPSVFLSKLIFGSAGLGSGIRF